MRQQKLKYPTPAEPMQEFVETFVCSSEFSNVLEATNLGADAYSDGVPSSDNPYDLCSMEYCSWLNGWIGEHNACTSV